MRFQALVPSGGLMQVAEELIKSHLGAPKIVGRPSPRLESDILRPGSGKECEIRMTTTQ